MPSDRKSSLILPVAGAAIVLLLALYVGAYYKMVEPAELLLPGGTAAKVPLYRSPVRWISDPAIYPNTRSDLFSPMNWLDRRIRPHIWEPTP